MEEEEKGRTIIINKELLREAIHEAIMKRQGIEAGELVEVARMCGMEVLLK